MITISVLNIHHHRVTNFFLVRTFKIYSQQLLIIECSIINIQLISMCVYIFIYKRNTMLYITSPRLVSL